ncbi:MAG: tRNA uridine-5-carboxymethylaminomethyl(34) synthesis GTPase MnmE [Candidatus Omnitrophica bacterium]|nr:tRNA uridine-5-carboxymethylaminomethyl(34) synthesis GTPase MnmE [Candidatus Omnitrophota bacterium]
MSEFRLKDYKLGDTIAAIATFPGKSALGLVKVSGPKALTIASKIFKSCKKKNIKKVKTHTLHYGWIIEKTKNRKQKTEDRRVKEEIIDEVLLSVMHKPSTYTKEDVIEISSHGGVAVVNKILEVVLKQGARLALPGEFTYRALLGGRIDLLQAESIRGIVDAKSEDVLTLASSQLRGDTTLKVKQLKIELKELFIQTESAINFPEDDVDISSLNLSQKIEALSQEVDNLLKGSREAEIMCEGFKCVICGKANVGKSTLFNRLLKEERVIVSRFSGTTRDVIEETINIRGVPLRIYDTAGILEPKDLIAKKALKKALRIFSECDLVILVLDGSRRLEKGDSFLLKKVRKKNVIFVINKSDLTQRLNLKEIPKTEGAIVKMSTLKSKGLGDLEDAIYRKVYKQGVDRESIVFLSQYQRQILGKLASSLNQIKVFLKESRPIDFINIELKICLDNLGRLTGEVFSEEILKSIFSNFCIGK